MNTAKALRFPTGRTVARVQQDIRKNESDPIAVCSANGIPLPLNAAIEYLKERERLHIDSRLQDIGDLDPLIPDTGGISWIVGPPHSFALQSAASTAMLASRLLKLNQVAVVDYQCDSHRQSLQAQRFMHRTALMKKKGSPHAPAAEKCLSLLNADIAQWQMVSKFLQAKVPSVNYAKLPRKVKFKDSQNLLLAMNPRKVAIADLARSSSQARTIIADNSVMSLADLGSSAHFQLKGERPMHSLRALLASTDVIAEQMCIRDDDGRNLSFRRVTRINENTKRLALDPRTPLRDYVSSAVESALSWAQTVDELCEDWQPSEATRSRLMRNAEKRDHLEQKYLVHIGIHIKRKGVHHELHQSL